MQTLHRKCLISLTVLVKYTHKFLTETSTYIIYRIFFEVNLSPPECIYRSNIREAAIAMMSGDDKTGQERGVYGDCTEVLTL